MQPSLLNYLICSDCCSHELRLCVTKKHRTSSGKIEIEEGSLVCGDCGETYVIKEGIPRMLPRDLRGSMGCESDQVEGTLRTACGYDIHHLRKQSKVSRGGDSSCGQAINLELARQYFCDYLALGTSDLQSLAGRVMLDAGCGGGRFMAVAHENGAADVVGLDLSIGGLLRARSLLDSIGHFHLVQGDITRPPFRPGVFDIVYSIGVIHHLPHPQEGFRALESLVCPGGRLWIWVYGLEGMSLVYRFSHLVWLRSLTRSWSLEAKFRLCRWFALGFGIYYLIPLRLLQRLFPYIVGRRLPFEWLMHCNYEDIAYALFDRLQPPYTHYLRKAELEQWLSRLNRVSIEAPNKHGWVIKGKRHKDRESKRQ